MNNYIKVSTNHKFRGKPEKQVITLENGELRTVHVYNGNTVNLGWNWQNVYMDYYQFFDKLSNSGWPVGPCLITNNKGNKKAETFRSHSLLIADIDYGMTIEELLEHPLYVNYGGGYYTSPRHTEEAHRFRVVFRLSRDIESMEMMRDAYKAIITNLGSDDACKDPARFFCGSINAVRSEITERILPMSVLKALIADWKQDECQVKGLEKKASSTTITYREPTDDEKQQFIELAASTYIGEYPIWRNFGWAMKQGGYSLEDFQYVTQGMMNQKSNHDAEVIWKAGTDQTNFGYAINILKQYNGDDCLHKKPKSAEGMKSGLEYMRNHKKSLRQLGRNKLKNI